MRGDWLKYGSKSFSFSVLEEIKKNDGQTDEEFSRDIATLHEYHLMHLALASSFLIESLQDNQLAVK